MFKSSNSVSIYSGLSQWIPTINATARECELACIIIANRFDDFVIMPPSWLNCWILWPWHPFEYTAAWDTQRVAVCFVTSSSTAGEITKFRTMLSWSYVDKICQRQTSYKAYRESVINQHICTRFSAFWLLAFRMDPSKTFVFCGKFFQMTMLTGGFCDRYASKSSSHYALRMNHAIASYCHLFGIFIRIFFLL